MGQTPSRDKQYYDMYNSYIQQQQELISKQQNQINSLYQMNIDTQQLNHVQQLNQQQQIPPNLLFQQGGNPLPRITSENKIKLDPYKILNLPKNYDEKTLKNLIESSYRNFRTKDVVAIKKIGINSIII